MVLPLGTLHLHSLYTSSSSTPVTQLWYPICQLQWGQELGYLSFQQAASLSSDYEGLLYHKELVRSPTERLFHRRRTQSLFSPSTILAEGDKGSNPSFATCVKSLRKIFSEPLHRVYDPHMWSHKMWGKCPNPCFSETYRRSGAQLV